jgi:dTDP-4-amino-4,6-dideoxygalactose transaminase
VRFFDPGLGYQKLKPEVDAEIQRVLSAGDLILRDDVEKFEQNLAEFVGTKYAIGLNSGTDALYLALKAIGIEPGEKVLVPSHTFVATAQVAAQLGAIPVLYDMGDDLIAITLGQKPKAIVVAHIAGEFMCDMTELLEWSYSYGIPVVEDACQALGAVQGGRGAGSFGIAGAFSFYPAKILGAYGDAGALVTDDESIYNEVKELRNHYKKDYSKWGINSRLDNLQAGVLNVKFKYLPQTLDRRRAVAEAYLSAFGHMDHLNITLPRQTEGRVWQDFIFRTEERDALYEFLKDKGVETMKNEYPFPVQKLFKSLEYEAETLRLPINEHITDEEVGYVIKCVKEFYS